MSKIEPPATLPARLVDIQKRYTGTVADDPKTYEVRGDDLAWLLNEVELASRRTASVGADVDLCGESVLSVLKAAEGFVETEGGDDDLLKQIQGAILLFQPREIAPAILDDLRRFGP